MNSNFYFGDMAPREGAFELPLVVGTLSGGLDSTTALALAKRAYGQKYVNAISFDYGQRHAVELECARYQAEKLVNNYALLQTPMMSARASSLTNRSLEVPQDGEPSDGLPSTFVPGRNILFFLVAAQHAAAYAKKGQAIVIVTGVNAVDYSGYPDCRPEAIMAIQTALNVAMDREIYIWAPLIYLRKSEIIARGLHADVDYAMTHSCYSPREDGAPCGKCDSCRIRLQGFQDCNRPDPQWVKYHGASETTDEDSPG